MSVFSSGATQIWPHKPPHRKSQLRARNVGNPFQFVSRKGLGAKRRNTAIMRRAGGWMQQYGRSLVAILVGLLLCGAFRAEAATPAEEAIARGKALVVAGDCAGCHTAD